MAHDGLWSIMVDDGELSYSFLLEQLLPLCHRMFCIKDISPLLHNVRILHIYSSSLYHIL